MHSFNVPFIEKARFLCQLSTLRVNDMQVYRSTGSIMYILQVNTMYLLLFNTSRKLNCQRG